MEPATTAPREVKPTGCCPPFDPVPWQDREIVWNDKLFVKDHVHEILHVPIDMGRKVLRNMKLIEAAGALPAQNLMLADEISSWGADVYIQVTKDVPGAQMATLSGTFLTRVYEGPWREIREWIADMNAFVASKGKKAEKLYFAYTTCPKCAEAYGKNYVVIFAKLGALAS